MTDNKRLLLIINPHAGKMRANSSLFAILSELCAAGYEPTVYLTKCQGDATEKVKADGDQFGTIVCCGGDGTLNETINGLMALQTKPTVGYIPCGTTNDFASTLGLPTNIRKAAKVIAAGNEKTLDLGSFGGRYFSYVASFGMFTQASYDTPQQVKNTLGHFAYILDAASLLSKIKPYKIRCICDDYIDEGEFIFGGITNSTSLAGVIKLPSEMVDLSDGMLEVFLLRQPKNPTELNDLLWAVSAKDYENENIVMHHGRHIEIICDEPLAFTLDGEFGGEITDVKIDCEKQALRIIL